MNSNFYLNLSLDANRNMLSNMYKMCLRLKEIREFIGKMRFSAHLVLALRLCISFELIRADPNSFITSFQTHLNYIRSASFSKIMFPSSTFNCDVKQNIIFAKTIRHIEVAFSWQILLTISGIYGCTSTYLLLLLLLFIARLRERSKGLYLIKHF